MRLAAALAVWSLLACARSPERIGPSPDNKSAPTSPPPEPPKLTLTDVRCVYGGTAPAFFVWTEARSNVRVTNLKATRFEITGKGATWVSGAAATIAVRTRQKANGEGDVTELKAPLEAETPVHLEVFGALALAPFGPGASYPTDDREFRVELVADQGRWTLGGRCAVGPAG